MNFETLLPILHEHRKTIAENLDEASRKQLIQYLESYISSGQISDDFFILCGSKFPDFAESKRIGSKDKEKLTPANIKTFTNELIEAVKTEALKKQYSKPEKKEK